MQSVHAGDGLKQAVVLQILVDIEHSIARLIETREQLVDDDQDVGAALRGEVLKNPALVGLRVLADIRRPPLLYLGNLGLVRVLVPLSRVGRRDDDGAGDEAGRVERLLVADGGELAVGGELPLEPRIAVVLVEVRGDVPGDQVDTVPGPIDAAARREFALEVRSLLFG